MYGIFCGLRGMSVVIIAVAPGTAMIGHHCRYQECLAPSPFAWKSAQTDDRDGWAVPC